MLQSGVGICFYLLKKAFVLFSERELVIFVEVVVLLRVSLGELEFLIVV